MSKKYKLTAKEIKHAYENPQYLKDTFKECFVPEYTIQEEKKKPIVIFVKQKAITQLGEEKIKQECAKTIETMLNL